LNKIEKGNFGSMWTIKGEQKLNELIHVSRTIQKGVLEELENTEGPEAYFQR
jgi:DNA-binding FadR family transcriptional regulator